MKVIHKETLYVGTGTLFVNTGFVPLDVQIQGGFIMLWYEVDAVFGLKSKVPYQVVGTGQTFYSEGWQYIATVQELVDVWHVYIRENNNAKTE